jgi:serine-type D-Ala-D-Ala carboxypeptidase/endopeptidase (penicillin-binding protein 4)
LEQHAHTNALLFVDRLTRAGVEVKGGVAVARAPAGATPLFAVDSADRHGLLSFMLSESDNMMAESFVREIGLRSKGVGSTPAGVEAIDEAIMKGLCLDKEGINDDGSGVSHLSQHSAHYWRHLLEAMRAQPWGDEFVSELGVSGRTGTMKSRLTDYPGAVMAKTGTVSGGRALSGYATTAAGRSVVFSIIGNGDDTLLTTKSIDDLVGAVVGFAG